MTDDGRPTYVEVDLEAIRDNVRTLLGALSPVTRLFAVVKADGYGHGAVPVARAALGAGASGLAVALAEEGRTLREAGIQSPILVLSPTMRGQVPLVAEYGLEPAVFDLNTCQALAQQAQERRTVIRVHLKVDTGMGRVGIPDTGPVVELAGRIARLPGIDLHGLMTHLADADHEDMAYTERQWERFLNVAETLRTAGLLPPVIHAANSAAAFRFPGLQCDLVRTGIALYGLDPYPGAPSLRPALSLKTRVAMVKRVPAGFAVGYGHTYVTRVPTTLASLPIGYADGYPRGLSNRGIALLHGRRVPVVGRVSMDQMVLGLPADLDAAVDDEVVLLGKQGDDAISAAEWAGWLDTIHYEVVTRIGSRVPRWYRVGSGLFPASRVDDKILDSL